MQYGAARDLVESTVCIIIEQREICWKSAQLLSYIVRKCAHACMARSFNFNSMTEVLCLTFNDVKESCTDAPFTHQRSKHVV